MLRATEIVPAGTWKGEPADVVRLDYDKRTRRRISLTGAGGLTFLLDLAKAPVLRAGDCIRLEDGRLVAVEAASEKLLEISCRDARLLARIACLSQTAEVFFATHGLAAAHEMVRERSGRWFDPEVAGAFLAIGPEDRLWADLVSDDPQHHAPVLAERCVVDADAGRARDGPLAAQSLGLQPGRAALPA